LGLVKPDGGMLICMLEAFDIPLILRKSDGALACMASHISCFSLIDLCVTSRVYVLFIGGYGYDSTDMAAVKYRLADLNR
jgi:hypothetical protein